MILVLDRSQIPIAPGKDPPDSVLIELPLVNVLGDILLICPERIPDIDRDIIAVQIEECNVEIDANERLGGVVQGNAGGKAGRGKGGRFGEKENGHEEHGADAHEGAEGGGLWSDSVSEC